MSHPVLIADILHGVFSSCPFIEKMRITAVAPTTRKPPKIFSNGFLEHDPKYSS
jgi:hypothetical protein